MAATSHDGEKIIKVLPKVVCDRLCVDTRQAAGFLCVNGVFKDNMLWFNSLGIFHCADIERQMQAIQKKRKELSDAATQQEKVIYGDFDKRSY